MIFAMDRQRHLESKNVELIVILSQFQSITAIVEHPLLEIPKYRSAAVELLII